jgi:hypothetical protein
MDLDISTNDLKSHREFQLLDIPKNELKQLRYMFEHKRIQFLDTLIMQLSLRTDKSEDQIRKLFGSYGKEEKIPMGKESEELLGTVNLKRPEATWEMFLQVLEEEVKQNDETDYKISYTSKNIQI